MESIKIPPSYTQTTRRAVIKLR